MPIVSYQGGKSVIAKKIIDIISPNIDDVFYDVCCGTGAVSIELINRNHDPSKIRMFDHGPWGLFWKLVGDGKFDINKFYLMCLQVPKDYNKVKDYIKELSQEPAYINTPYIYLLLQASSFGGKAIWIDKNYRWKNYGFRNYWKPTLVSNRRSPVKPMLPEPMTICQRTALICEKMLGVKAVMCDVVDIEYERDCVIYIDPPYDGSTTYGYSFDIIKYVNSINRKCYVSEGKPLSDMSYLISEGTKKGGISGSRKKIHEEWLSIL
jgi:site-specific DNA-adenine methylase